MAAGNLSLVAKRVLHLLGPHQQQGLLGGVAKTVSKLAPLLLDAEKKSQRDLCIRYWLTDLEDVLYDVDNLLTEIEIEKKKKKSFPSQVRTSTYSQEIKQVMKRLDDIAIGRKDFDLKKISSEAEAAAEEEEEEEEEVHRLRRGESSPTSYLNQEESLVLFEKIAFESKSGDSAADTAQCQKNSKTFHACFNFDPSSTEDVTMFDAKKMRTIFLSGQSRRIYRGIGVGKIFEKITYKFRFLLALDMQASGLEIVPNSIGKLKLLKYLDLSENEELTMLPNSITELIDLQTLILSKCFKLEKLPKDFTNLVNLRHFEIDGCNNLANLSPQIKNLSHLKELSQLVLSVESSSSSSRQQHGIKEKKMLPESSELIQQFKIKNLRLKNLRHEETAIQYLRAVPSEIQSLSLEWRVDKWNKSVYGELPLHNNLLSYLEELSINGFKGVIVRCPSSQFSSKLVKLSLSRCSNCKNLQAIHQIHGLKVLVLEYLDNLEYILVGHELFFSSTNNPNLFSSLERLWLTDLPKLQGWCEYNYINVLPSLTKLVIENCPKLSSMPRFPDLKEGLVMDRTSWKLLDMTMNRCTSSSTTTAATTSLNPFSNLESICIVDIEDFKDDIPWSTLNKLRFLRFDCIKELDTLPSKLQDVLSLQELQVWRCPIKEIPSWITKFKKLEKLVFGVCPLLKELPENFSRVQIQTLEIKDCNMLLRRLEVGKGADWSKIKFIPEKKLGPISGR
ncbi:hypothetical protein CsatB_021289 [Cannabis sativa]